MSRIRDWRPWLLGISALVIALDRITKLWVSRHIIEGDAITVIPHVFRISHVENSGAAFSMFTSLPNPERTRWMLTAFSLLAAVVVLVVLFRVGRKFSLTALSMALVLGGALGFTTAWWWISSRCTSSTTTGRTLMWPTRRLSSAGFCCSSTRCSRRCPHRASLRRRRRRVTARERRRDL
jgi:signal peptidase II